jgi:hypothetical protein
MREDDHQQRLLDAAMDKRLRNLQAVARHLQAGTPGAESSDAPTVKATTSAAQKWKRWGPVGLVLAFVLGKLKLIIPALKFAKLGTLLSMVVAVWVYAQIWGAPFALGFVLLILVHELGHALVMRQQGIPAGAPVFIPFVGAVIAMRGIPRSAWVEALVGIGGPVLGSVGALACLAIASITDSLLWYALASTGFLINRHLSSVAVLDPAFRIVWFGSRHSWATRRVLRNAGAEAPCHGSRIFRIGGGACTLHVGG